MTDMVAVGRRKQARDCKQHAGAGVNPAGAMNDWPRERAEGQEKTRLHQTPRPTGCGIATHSQP
jgi:hypothetical protein